MPGANTCRRAVAVVLLVISLVTLLAPVAQAASAADDLKQIEYTYYFRGRYQQAIEALQTFLARVDLPAPEKLRAREFLAASYVLGGAPVMGQQVFLQIMTEDATYVGPDPGMFKLDVMDAYAEARSQFTALALRDSALTGDAGASDATEPVSPLTQSAPTSKPIYKKWWLYAGVAAVAIAAGVLAGGGEDSGPPAERGTVVVGVQVK